jgi:hypothetical protein
MNRILFWTIGLCLLFPGFSKGQVPGNRLFDKRIIHQIRIISLFENLKDTLDANYMLSFGMNQFQIRDIPYAPAKLSIDGVIIDTLGIRYKGFNSWWHSVKKPLKIDLNRYRPGQEYDGLKKFNLHNGSGDPSFVRENLDYNILRSLGIKAPRTSYAQVYMDTVYIGMYRIVEQVDNTFLDVNFGNHQGNLYVQEAVGTAGFSMGWEGSGQDAYYKSISLENHQKENDWSDFVHFLDVLNNTDDNHFRDSILMVFDVDEYLQILAFDIAVNNLDFYGNSGRNFYLYNDNGIFHWIPWDYNLSWREGSQPINIDSGLYPVLIRRILQVPEFQSEFLRKYCRIKPYFSDSYIKQLVTDETSAISVYMKDDPYQDYPFEAFIKNRDSSWARIPGLVPFAAERYQEISETLESMHIDCKVSSDLPPFDQDLFEVYPLPANDWLNIGMFPGREVSVTIYNINSQIVRKFLIFEKGRINVSDLPSGSYFLKVFDFNKVYSKLVIVEH